MTFLSFRETFKPLFKVLKIMNIYEVNLYLIANFIYLHCYGKLQEPIRLLTRIIQGQHKKYTLILKEQIMENFLFNIEEQ